MTRVRIEIRSSMKNDKLRHLKEFNKMLLVLWLRLALIACIFLRYDKVCFCLLSIIIKELIRQDSNEEMKIVLNIHRYYLVT